MVVSIYRSHAVGAEAKRVFASTVAAVLVACAPAAPSDRSVPDVADATSSPMVATGDSSFAPVRGFSRPRALRHVRVLAGRIGPRAGGSRAYHRAVRYVEGRLQRYGWEAEVDRFRLPQGGRSANVIATSGSASGKTVVLGAHLDTVRRSPGANDNASGTAVLLELSRILAGTRFAPRLVLVAFGAEEEQPRGGHHYGSMRYARQLRAGRRPAARAMASIDMIGKRAPLIVGWTGTGKRTMVRALLRSAERADVRADDLVVGDVSDHVPFARVGVPAALLWTGFEPNHHEPTDVVSGVDPPALRNAGEVVLGAIRRLLRR